MTDEMGMTNKEVFAKYGDMQWAIESNLCFLLQEFWETVKDNQPELKLPSHPSINPVSFVKKWMKEETIVEVGMAERNLQKNLSANENVIEDAEYKEVEDAEYREI